MRVTSAMGQKGAKGDKGDSGAASTVAGPAGPKGDTGATGLQGPKGDAGVAGPQGAQGIKGDTGATGSAGAAGAVGATGPTGLTGPKGDTGATGPAGAAGTNATTTSNATTTVAGLMAPADKNKLDQLQRVRLVSDSSGLVTWTFAKPFPAGSTPVVAVTPENSTAGSNINHKITAISNTAVTVQLSMSSAVTLLGVSVLGVNVASSTPVHMDAGLATQ